MATFTNQSLNTASYSNQIASLEGNVTATAGLYRGFGAFTYAGGEILVAGGAPVFTNGTLHTATYSNQTKN